MEFSTFNENLTRPERKESVRRVVISTSTSPTDLLVQDLSGLLLTIRSLSFSSLQRGQLREASLQTASCSTAVLRISITCGFLNWMQRAFVCHDPSSRPGIQGAWEYYDSEIDSHISSPPQVWLAPRLRLCEEMYLSGPEQYLDTLEYMGTKYNRLPGFLC